MEGARFSRTYGLRLLTGAVDGGGTGLCCRLFFFGFSQCVCGNGGLDVMPLDSCDVESSSRRNVSVAEES